MLSIKYYLLFVFLTLNVNVVFANSNPEEVAAVCGETPCDIMFKKIQKFAKNGSSHAQAVLALLYRGGHGTEINHQLSLKYMKRAAKNRLSFAQYDLGILYRLGHLVEKNEAEADAWLMKSAQSGYKPAIELLASENKISKEENEILWPKDDEEIERITITRENYTLSDLVDYLSTMGYSRKSNTGSRIRGKGCGSGGASCVTLKVNTPVGRTHFDKIISTINATETGRQMNSMVK